MRSIIHRPGSNGEAVRAFAPLSLGARAERGRHLVGQAQGVQPAAHASEDAAFIHLGNARPLDVLVREAAPNTDLEPVAPALDHVVVQEFGAEQSNDDLLGDEVVVDGRCRRQRAQMVSSKLAFVSAMRFQMASRRGPASLRVDSSRSFLLGK